MANRCLIKRNGSWQSLVPYKKVNGQWQRCPVYKKENGTWVRIDQQLVTKTKVIVENLSIEKEFRKEFEIDKIEIAKNNFNLVRRRSIELLKTLNKIGE